MSSDLRNAVQRRAADEARKPCKRCGGQGSIEGFSYMDGGRCWRCMGSGVEPKPEERTTYEKPIKVVNVPDPKRPGGLSGYSISLYPNRVVIIGGPYAVSLPADSPEEAKRLANDTYKTIAADPKGYDREQWK
jgi:hypothetical protein